MTFTELVTDACDRLNLTNAEAQARIGRFINSRYRRVTSSIGLQTSRRTTVQAPVTLGVQTVTLTGIEKVLALYHSATGVQSVLPELTYDQLRIRGAGDGMPTAYAIERMDANSVTVLLDTIPQTEFDIYADGMQSVTTLSGSDEPPFPASYHDLLVYGAMADELTKMEKPKLAIQAEARFEAALSDLRMYIAKSAYLQQKQGGYSEAMAGLPASSGGSGSGTGGGATNYTQTGLVTFDRDPLPPFAVAANSAVVPNLIAASATNATNATTLAGAAAATYHDAALLTGVIPDAAVPAPLPARSAGALFNLNASALNSGTVPDARFPSALPAVSGVNLTALNASNIASGTLDAARLPATAVKTNASASFSAGVLTHATQPRAFAYGNATQSFGDSTATPIAFNTEVFDVGDLHDNVTTNTRFTIPTGGDGLYLLVGRICYAGNATGMRAGWFRKGGTTELGAQVNSPGSASGFTCIGISQLAVLAAGEYVELVGYQTSGGSLSTGHGSARNTQNEMSVVKLW